MTNRVALGLLPGGGYGLLVSVPGSNVLDPNLSNEKIAFDSRWMGSSMVVTMGSVAVPTGSTTTVNFGRTLPEPPVVIGMIVLATGARMRMGWYGDQIVHVNNSEPSTVNPQLQIWSRGLFIRVYNNRFELPPTPSSGLTLEYIVIQRT